MKTIISILEGRTFDAFSRIFLFLIIRIILWGTITFLIMMKVCAPEIQQLLNHLK